jgi:hypothetical protein
MSNENAKRQRMHMENIGPLTLEELTEKQGKVLYCK